MDSQTIQDLLQEMCAATRRPLFTEIGLIRSRQRWNNSSQRNWKPELSITTRTNDTIDDNVNDSQSNAESIPSKRTWVQLLKKASDVVTFMSEEEHGKVLRIVSILFLGFLLPYSTGNDYYLLKNNIERPPDGADLLDEYILRLPLDERLEKSTLHNRSIDPIGEDVDGCLTDQDVELALEDFLFQLGSLLQRRPYHREEVDLLHLFAMVIQPISNPQDYQQPISVVFANNPFWLQTQQLMSKAFGIHFQIHHGHRRRMVQLIRDCLVLPENLEESSGDVIAPLLFGSLLHLRSSLRNFSIKAREDDVLAMEASMKIAAQIQSCRIFRKPEWDYFLNHMVDDQLDCHCVESLHCGKKEINSYCPYYARGGVLGKFILVTCRSERNQDPAFALHMATSLSEAIEWQVDCWLKDRENDEGNDEVKKLHPPCLLASLLKAASQLFAVQYSPQKNVLEHDDENDAYTTLIRTCIHLLNHSDDRIVTEAANLLVYAFSNKKCILVDSFASLLLGVIKERLKRGNEFLLSSLVSVISSKSPSFAFALFTTVLDTLQKNELLDDAMKDSCCRLLPAISLNCPQTARQDYATLDLLLRREKGLPRAHHIIASMMSSRFAYFFEGKNEKIIDYMQYTLIDRKHTWSTYQLARLALQTGNFYTATKIYNALLCECNLSNEETFVWLSFLEKFSCAENELSCNWAMGIPKATLQLQHALSYIHSLELLCRQTNQYLFQRWFLLLRLDFLDLTTVLRHFTRDMRLTGGGPVKHSRSLLHLKNVVKGFDSVAQRYCILKRRHGMYFQDHQSRASLKILGSLASFMATATRIVFSECFVLRSTLKDEIKIPATDTRESAAYHPVLSLLQRLDLLILHPMVTESITPVARAAAMLELIDGILQVPIPIPRHFFVPRPTCVCDIRIAANPDYTYDGSDKTILEAVPMLSSNFNASGQVPQSLLANTMIPTYTLILWYRVVYTGPLTREEDNKDEDAGKDEDVCIASGDQAETATKIPDLSLFLPTHTNLLPNRNFFFTAKTPPLQDEGFYELELRLGCRDIKGNEWEIPLNSLSQKWTIRVSRSR